MIGTVAVLAVLALALSPDGVPLHEVSSAILALVTRRGWKT